MASGGALARWVRTLPNIHRAPHGLPVERWKCTAGATDTFSAASMSRCDVRHRRDDGRRQSRPSHPAAGGHLRQLPAAGRVSCTARGHVITIPAGSPHWFKEDPAAVYVLHGEDRQTLSLLDGLENCRRGL